MSCDVALLILQAFRRFTYITTHPSTLPSLHLRQSSAHSPTFPSLHLRHNTFSNPFHRLTYVTAHCPTLPLLRLRHSSFSNPSFASSTSQALHLIHLASRPCCRLGLEPLCDTHLRLSVILTTMTLTGQEFFEVYEKMEIIGLEVRAIG